MKIEIKSLKTVEQGGIAAIERSTRDASFVAAVPAGAMIGVKIPPYGD